VPIALTRRHLRVSSLSCVAGLSALAFSFSAVGVSDAAADADTRTISMHHVHSGEDITITFKKNGRFDDEALKKLNWFLRDWRRNEPTKMDPRLIDIVYEVWRDVGARNPVSVIGGYRAPATNDMLRRRSKGVARNSQHTLGHAIDFYIPGTSLEEMRIAGLRLQRGGVGYYPTSGSPFVHLDTGSVRHWPRMSHDQLARVFPNGRTVHVPSDGRPLQGYALALADVEKRGAAPSEMSLEAARSAGVSVSGNNPKRNLLAALFNRGKDDDEDDATASVSAKPARTVAAIDLKKTPEPKSVAEAKADAKAAPKAENIRLAAVPLPVSRPPLATKPVQVAQPAQVASAMPTLPAQVVAALANSPMEPSSPSAVVASRGAWDDAGALRQVGEGALATFASASSPPAPAADPQVAGYANLAYAAVEKNVPAKPASNGLHFTRKANAAEIGTPPLKPSLPAAEATPRYDDVWLRAVMLAPDLHNYLSATLIGAPDPKELRALMRKPASTLAMSFSDDPMGGMETDHFAGEAVVFLETISLVTRSAALR
jgi:uncharacterized protein YcbK (DUF882 family)